MPRYRAPAYRLESLRTQSRDGHTLVVDNAIDLGALEAELRPWIRPQIPRITQIQALIRGDRGLPPESKEALVELVEVYAAPYGCCSEILWNFAFAITLAATVVAIMSLAIPVVGLFIAAVAALTFAALVFLLLGCCRQCNVQDRRRLEKELAEAGISRGPLVAPLY
jgi:hypothetical protein